MSADYRLPGRVAWSFCADGTGTAAVAHLPDGPPYALDASASTVWLAALEGGTTDDVVSRVAALSDVAPAAVAVDVRSVLADLVDLGLLLAPDQAPSSESR